MALNAYLTIKGQKQGQISGSVTIKGRENSIAVHAFNHNVDAPRDPASGLPTGKRMHNPFFIVKEVDKSSPLLWSALVANENLLSWELDIWQPQAATAAGATATDKLVYTIKLTNANIASIHEAMPDNQDPSLAARVLQEQIGFTYQKIQWIWADGNTTATDDWEVPVA